MAETPRGRAILREVVGSTLSGCRFVRLLPQSGATRSAGIRSELKVVHIAARRGFVRC